jgi:serine/threonine-protein kinase HipA
MKLGMAVGANRHYVVHTIVGRHFLQTAEICGHPSKMANEVIEELGDTGKGEIDEAISQLPAGFPPAVAASISDAAKRRLDLLSRRGAN